MPEPGHCPLHPDEALKPACSTADFFWGATDERFRYGTCNACGSLILSPRPAPAEMGPHYAGYYSDTEITQTRDAYARKKPAAAGGVHHMRAMDFVRTMKKLGAPLGSGQRLLDVGCGLACFARSVREASELEVRGVDFDPKCQAFAAEVHQIEVDSGELADQRYADGAFDYVTSWHCLEHVYDPVAELKEMARITAPGGYVQIEVPTVGPIGKLFRGKWLFLQAPTHLFLPRPEILKQLVADAGLKPIKVIRPWLPTEIAGSLMLLLGQRGGFVPRVLLGKRFGDWLWRVLFGVLMLIDLPITFLMALMGQTGGVRVIARKP